MARQFAPDRGEIEFTALWIPEVPLRSMRFAAFQHPQGSQTATLDPQEAKRGIPPCQMGSQQFQSRVTREDHYRVLQELLTSAQIDGDAALHGLRGPWSLCRWDCHTIRRRTVVLGTRERTRQQALLHTRQPDT